MTGPFSNNELVDMNDLNGLDARITANKSELAEMLQRANEYGTVASTTASAAWATWLSGGTIVVPAWTTRAFVMWCISNFQQQVATANTQVRLRIGGVVSVLGSHRLPTSGTSGFAGVNLSDTQVDIVNLPPPGTQTVDVQSFWSSGTAGAQYASTVTTGFSAMVMFDM